MSKPTLLQMPPDMYPVHLFHPHFESLDFWFPAKDAWVLEALCRQAKAVQQPMVQFMEIGSFVGTSASILSQHCDWLVCVDTWAGSAPGDQVNEWYKVHDVRSVFDKNIAQLPKSYIIHTHQRTLNPDSLPVYLSNYVKKFALIFIDGAHDYESVKADIALAKQWIAPGGIICGHDCTVYEGVTQAVTELGELATICGTVWWIGKTFEEMLDGCVAARC